MLLAWDSDTRIGIISSSAAESKRIRPGGTGAVGPAIAGPTFELCRIFFLNSKQNCELLRTKSVYNKKATSSNRKIATNCDSGI